MRLRSRRATEYQAGGSSSDVCPERNLGMQVRSSLKSLKKKDGSVVVRRRGRTFIVNKLHPRWKARQG
jgi:large subunit ribosomal protein L36